MFPRSSQSYFFIGDIHRTLKRTDEAIRNYEKALELDPANGMAKQRLAERKGD